MRGLGWWRTTTERWVDAALSCHHNCGGQRLAFAIYFVLAGAALGLPAVGKLGLGRAVCATRVSLCADPRGGLDGYNVGHDEPSLEFKSSVPGSGNDMTYVVTLSKDPTVEPNATGVGGTTWGFELHPTFWFGMTMCDTESAPG